MRYSQTETIACIEDTKDASLFFDHIIPLNLAHIIPLENGGDLEGHEVLQGILPPVFLDSSHYMGLSKEFVAYIEAYVKAFPVSIGVPEAPEEIMEAHAYRFFPHLIEKTDVLFSMLQTPVDIFGLNTLPTNDLDQTNDPAFILSGLKLVDTSEVTWRHILDVKKDKEAIKKLKRLRAFIYQNYHNKPLAFIEDDILSRKEVYEATAKRLGLKTVNSSLKIIFGSSSLVANTAATIMTALSGGTIAIPLSLGLGALFTLGKVGLEIKMHKRELHAFKHENPLTYLVELEKIT